MAGLSETDLLPWHSGYWRQLMQRKAADRLPHALLCVGPVGVGKHVFVDRLVRSLLCWTPAGDGTPCGLCQGCRLVVAGSHPDYVCIAPEDIGKPIKIDQIRHLCSFLGYTSQFSGYKIALIRAADRMNLNAANSLLKTLEEPPAASLLILVSAQPAKLPATVRSRCQTLIFRKPDSAQARAWLAPRIRNMDPVLLLNLSHGAPLVALAYAEESRLAWRQELMQSYVDVVTGKLDPVRAAERWLKGDVAENLRWLIDWHRDMVRLKMTMQVSHLLSSDLHEALWRLVERLSIEDLFLRLDSAIQLYGLYGTQVNLQLMLETFLGDSISA